MDYRTELTEQIERIAAMPPDTPENRRYCRAKFMFEFLVDREAWLGCRDWDELDSLVQAAFMDGLAWLESAAASTEVE
jgi:hypothetical protein